MGAQDAQDNSGIVMAAQRAQSLLKDPQANGKNRSDRSDLSASPHPAAMPPGIDGAWIDSDGSLGLSDSPGKEEKKRGVRSSIPRTGMQHPPSLTPRTSSQRPGGPSPRTSRSPRVIQQEVHRTVPSLRVADLVSMRLRGQMGSRPPTARS